MPEGDTVHRWAARMNTALGGREIALAEAPDPRSPAHGRAADLRGRIFERAEARGKHLLAHLSGGIAVHSHLGINGRWFVSPDGRRPHGRPWLVLASGRAVASQRGGKLLRIARSSRIRNDPGLLQLGPDPLRCGFDPEAAAARLLHAGHGREVGDALLDQRIIAGIGNAIRTEACFQAGIDPWRRVEDLDRAEALRLVEANQRVMRISLRKGRRPRSIYRAASRGCPRCGTPIRSRGQGDANRTAYWCPRCQR